MNILRKAAFAVICLIAGGILTAQVSVDPSDIFYDQLEIWEVQGVVSDLPPLRPYPLTVIRDILVSVINGSDDRARTEAEELYAYVFAKPYHVDISADARFKFSDDSNAKQAVGFAGLAGDLFFLDTASASYKLNFAGAVNPDAAVLPAFTALPHTFRDAATIGPVDIFTEMNGSVAVGSSRFYAQAGINHNSFGDFYNTGVVLSPDAQHTVNFSVVLDQGSWSYTHGLFVLGASNNAGYDVYPNKFLAIHSLTARICRWLSASFYETVVYGDRFDPAYLIPMPFMIAQGISGFDDNLIMGLAFTVTPVAGLSWSTDLYIDDLEVEDLVKFKFDTKIRGAFQTGIKYAPLNLPVLKLVQADYTLITPYMYAHKQNITDPATGSFIVGGASAVNYQAYTNAGKALGSQLDPNSDRVSLAVTLEPVDGLKIGISGAFIRHANVNESLTTEEALRYLNAPAGYFLTDGSIHNHQHIGYVENGTVKYDYLDSAWNRFMFMEQDTKMYVVQAGLSAEYRFPAAAFGQFSVGLGYTFEYIKNWGVQNNMFPGTGTIDKDGSWESGTKTEADVAEALAAWKSHLKDVINNYLTISLKYRY